MHMGIAFFICTELWDIYKASRKCSALESMLKDNNNKIIWFNDWVAYLHENSVDTTVRRTSFNL